LLIGIKCISVLNDAVDPLAQNVLINPRHPDIGLVTVKETIPFGYDQRLLLIKW